MNYKIITDEVEFNNFIAWLPDLEPHETYYISLLARKKYDGNLPGDKNHVKRFTTDTQRMFWKVKQLECELGSYMIKGKPVSQESLALYITINPRDIQKAAKKALKDFADVVTKPYAGYNPHQMALTAIHQSRSNVRYVVFDIDKPAIHPFPKIGEAWVLGTRGGYHLLVDPSKQTGQWHQQIIRLLEPDQHGDLMSPVPGCIQGGFTPRLVKL